MSRPRCSQPSPHALAMRCHRERKAAGIEVVCLEVDIGMLEEQVGMFETKAERDLFLQQLLEDALTGL